MKKLINPVDVAAVALAALLIWTGQSNSSVSLTSITLFVFGGTLLGVFVNKVATRYQAGTKATAQVKKK